jgi:hypothetical protein
MGIAEELVGGGAVDLWAGTGSWMDSEGGVRPLGSEGGPVGGGVQSSNRGLEGGQGYAQEERDGPGGVRRLLQAGSNRSTTNLTVGHGTVSNASNFTETWAPFNGTATSAAPTTPSPVAPPAPPPPPPPPPLPPAALTDRVTVEADAVLGVEASALAARQAAYLGALAAAAQVRPSDASIVSIAAVSAAGRRRRSSTWSGSDRGQEQAVGQERGWEVAVGQSGHYSTLGGRAGVGGGVGVGREHGGEEEEDEGRRAGRQTQVVTGLKADDAQGVAQVCRIESYSPINQPYTTHKRDLITFFSVRYAE